MQNVKALRVSKKAPKAASLDSVAPAAILPAPPAEIILPESVAATVAPVAESKPNAADKRAAYVADSVAAKAIFASLSGSISIPIKPGAFKAIPLNPKAYSLSERGAAAIYVAVAASGKAFADGGTYARRFTIGATSYTIENGAFSDFIGTAYTIDSTGGLGNESFTLLPGTVAAIRAKLGAKISAFKL